MNYKVEAICAGTPQYLAKNEKLGENSAIGKVPLSGKVAITHLGIAGDQQADLRVHGGPEMAVHHYPLDHHSFWREIIGEHELLETPGGFGSNLAVSGIVESGVHLGDRFRLGTALLEVSQPRQPCWKIEARFEQKKMLKTILKSGRAGWYYRVIEEGAAQAGDTLELAEQGLTEWSIERLFEALWGTNSKSDLALLREISELSPLSERLRIKLRDRLL